MTKADRNEEAEVARHRTTIDEAREEGQGHAERGDAPVVPDYADAGGTSDLGVDEPTVPPEERGDPPPEEGDGWS